MRKNTHLSIPAAVAVAFAGLGSPASAAFQFFDNGSNVVVTLTEDLNFTFDANSPDSVFGVTVSIEDAYDSPSPSFTAAPPLETYGSPGTITAAFESSEATGYQNWGAIDFSSSEYEPTDFYGIFLFNTFTPQIGDEIVIRSGSLTLDPGVQLPEVKPGVDYELTLHNYTGTSLPLSAQTTSAEVVPEPGTFALLASFGALSLVLWRRFGRRG